jgi:hypothetical protein
VAEGDFHVAVGHVAEAFGHESFAGKAADGIEDGIVEDVPGAQLMGDHLFAGVGE